MKEQCNIRNITFVLWVSGSTLGYKTRQTSAQKTEPF